MRNPASVANKAENPHDSLICFFISASAWFLVNNLCSLHLKITPKFLDCIGLHFHIHKSQSSICFLLLRQLQKSQATQPPFAWFFSKPGFIYEKKPTKLNLNWGSFSHPGSTTVAPLDHPTSRPASSKGMKSLQQGFHGAWWRIKLPKGLTLKKPRSLVTHSFQKATWV